jgi:C4-dicarboxylate-specific signal transduction histidine kinase
MGQMATALAHELNQPLAAIANYSRGCLYRLESGSKATEIKGAMEHVCLQAERAGEIIASIRRFLSKDEATYSSVDLNALFADALRIIGPEAQEHECKISTRELGVIPAVMGEAIQLEQVILNIIRNGIEAMDASDTNDQRILTIWSELHEPGFVRILFEDRGPLASTIDLEQIFEAFYTTKPSGMGMGLPISRSIVEAHGGQLHARTNAPRNGLTFIMDLPTRAGGKSDV